MITCYTKDGSRAGLRSTAVTAGDSFPDNICWIDLMTPTKEEEKWVERFLGPSIQVPTRDEMQELELSNRLYVENNIVTMTATVVGHDKDEHPIAQAITSMITPKGLVTVRYHEIRAIQLALSRLEKVPSASIFPEMILMGLIEAIINRSADILEVVSGQIDALSHDIFTLPLKRKKNKKPVDLQTIMEMIGRKGDIVAKVRESLVSMGRLVSFYSGIIEMPERDYCLHDVQVSIKSLVRDQAALTDHATFLSGKISFLLDATLGMITNEQNGIIKIFSVAAVIFLPPTLIASIYGMNFEFMPELRWVAGYPMALVLMVISAILPFVYFKQKNWL